MRGVWLITEHAIAPVGATARALATLEVVFGQLYIAIMVAGLVAAYLQRGDTERIQQKRAGDESA